MQKITQYEYALETTPAPEPEDESQGQCAFALAASMLREALRLIAEVSDADTEDGVILTMRFAGLSLSEIGCRRKISKQAVHKRIRCMAARWPQLEDALVHSAGSGYDEHLAGLSDAILRKVQDNEKLRREKTKWMNKPN
jgi:predicted DNA-binding protein YlxM (UPF0122 family)